MRPPALIYPLTPEDLALIPKTQALYTVISSPMGPVIITTPKPNRFRKFERRS